MSKQVNKKAVVILGNPNGGKTTTILHCINTYEDPKRNQPRKRLLNQFYQLQQNKKVYVQGQSPTESKISLKLLLKDKKITNLIVAEQMNGNKYTDTMKYLRDEEYEIIEFTISNPTNKSAYWEYQLNHLPSATILKKRADDIFNCLSC